ncbi:hypothetical protein Bpfe_022215 [Biomphalaria pfeifferi]|uniref:Tyrosine-protein kinase ephrin type A/B receptor-like domain-containing protein n=1 Tax=Biomphalaria pfeifferi TaxID=112525 RepID=A0AAD8B6S0_BIOPF|nr:hypothetical protein Bpfe_022215 [Biomphalaria pfeifferi]
MKLFLKLTTKFSDAVNSKLVKGESTSLIDSLVQQMNIPNNASMPHVIDGEGCQPGTLGAYDDKIGAICRGCSLGHYLSSNNTCLPCPPGYYSDVPLKQRCDICPGLVSVTENVWAKVKSTGQWMAFAMSMCPKIYNEPNVNLSIAKALEAINKAYNSSNRPEVCIVVCVFLMLLYGLVEGKLSR